MCRVPPRTAAREGLGSVGDRVATGALQSNGHHIYAGGLVHWKSIVSHGHSVEPATSALTDPLSWLSETFRPLEELDAAAISQLSSGQHQLQYMVRLSKALMESASELLGLYNAYIGTGGVEAFEGPHVASPTSSSQSFSSSPRITMRKELDMRCGSHRYPRRFRGIVLVDPILWSTLCLWYDTTNENIKRCIRRSGKDSDLHVVINYNRFISSSALRNFLDTCSSSASRWRSLTLDGDWNMGDDQNLHSIGISLSQLLNQHSLVLPRLHELCLSERCLEKGDPSWVGFAPTFDASRPWATRNIRVLRCIQCIPPSSLPFTSLTSFTLSLNLLPRFSSHTGPRIARIRSFEDKYFGVRPRAGYFGRL